ncbi:toprim domain-containing protein [Ligaoa zhengdingensis]|uniref:toprim domain-containing protein n=1 Tax=Ligaoa zhengdingensis TaxID=2763658 RepID=UPI0031BA0177
MIKLRQAVVVEGRYDKIKLSSLLDATIIQTDGFRIFKDKDKVALLRELARRVGLVVLTDSDSAGFVIRNHIKSCVREGKVYHAYIPEILGKEKRKDRPSKEGTLGVEGVPAEVILQALRRAGVTADTGEARERLVTKADLMEDGLSGGEGSHERRTRLLRELGLPHYLSANSMLDVLNTMFSYEEYKRLAARVSDSAEPPEDGGNT